MFQLKVDQQDWNRLLAAHKNWLKSLHPSGAFGQFILFIATEARGRAQDHTHVDTGALSMSHRVAFSPTGLVIRDGPEAVVYVSPLRNPKTGLYTTEYAETEEARGGEHSFYELVIKTDLEGIVQQGLGIWGKEFFRG